MVSLLSSFQVLPRRRSVPVGRMTIDWSHPLTRGLVGCWVPGVMYGRDLTGTFGTDLTWTEAAGSPGPAGIAEEGPAWGSKTGYSTVMGGPLPPRLKALTQCSLYYRGDRSLPGNGGGSIPYPIFISYDNGLIAPYAAFGIGTNSYTDMGLIWNFGGTNTNSTGINVDVAGTMSLLGTFKPGGNATLYRNGQQAVQTAFGASAPTSGTAPQMGINGWYGSARFTNTLAYLACVWDRELSASEAAQIDADPYAFLVPAYQESLPVITAGGASIDHLAAAAVAIANASAGLRVWHHLNAAAASIASATADLDVHSTGQVHLAAAAAAIANATANIDRQAQLAAAASSIASASAALEVVAGNTKHLSASAQVIATATAAARAHLHFAADAKAVSTATATLPDRSSANFLVTTQMVVDMIMPAGKAHHQSGKVKRKKREREREMVD